MQVLAIIKKLCSNFTYLRIATQFNLVQPLHFLSQPSHTIQNIILLLVQCFQDSYSKFGPILQHLSHDIFGQLDQFYGLNFLHPISQFYQFWILPMDVLFLAMLFLCQLHQSQNEVNYTALKIKIFQSIFRSQKFISYYISYQTAIWKILQFYTMRSNQIENYEQQNKLLRQLFLQRQKARTMSRLQAGEKIEEESIRPTLKTQSKQGEDLSTLGGKKKELTQTSFRLYQNTPFFDTRQIKPDFFIKIFSLLNEDVSKPVRKVSQNVQSIFITTFGFETETFEQLLLTSKVKLIILNQSSEKETKIINKYEGFENFTVILKAKNHGQFYGVFHTKLWLIKFKTFLRVVVCTGNQHLMDWAVWQNAYWYQDFPLKTIGQTNEDQGKKKEESKFDFNKDFLQTLTMTLTVMLPLKQLQELTSIKIDNYVFQNIKVILIPSIPGRHYGPNMKKQGICKLKQVMKTFNNIPNPIVTYNSTSLGVIDRQFVQQLFTSFCPKKQIFQAEKFRLVYPTKRYIEEQTGGQAAVLFLTGENYKKSDIAKKVLHKYDTNPLNPILGSIPHLKSILIESSNQDESATKGILYLGSHNMTKAAWGKLQKQGSQLYIANSELGLVFLDVDIDEYKKWSPFKYPPQPYGPNDEPFLRDFLK